MKEIIKRPPWRERIKNISITGFEDSVRASKFSYLTDVNKADDKMTQGIKWIAKMPSNSGEDNFLLGVIVQFDITATIKWWTEMERYHFADIVTSQSTMHKLQAMNINLSMSSYVDPEMKDKLQDLIHKYNKTGDTKDWLTMIYSCPVGLFLTARMTTNYRALKTIYKQRRDHKLPEWQMFCDFIEVLPHSDLIVDQPSGCPLPDGKEK